MTNYLNHLPKMVQIHNARQDSGYSVIAEGTDKFEAGFFPTLEEAITRAQVLRSTPDVWMFGEIKPVAIYNVQAARCVRRFPESDSFNPQAVRGEHYI